MCKLTPVSACRKPPEPLLYKGINKDHVSWHLSYVHTNNSLSFQHTRMLTRILLSTIYRRRAYCLWLLSISAQMFPNFETVGLTMIYSPVKCQERMRRRYCPWTKNAERTALTASPRHPHTAAMHFSPAAADNMVRRHSGADCRWKRFRVCVCVLIHHMLGVWESLYGTKCPDQGTKIHFKGSICTKI